MGYYIYTKNESEQKEITTLVNEIRSVYYLNNKEKIETSRLFIEALKCYLEKLKGQLQK